jgi:hypothetical protein
MKQMTLIWKVTNLRKKSSRFPFRKANASALNTKTNTDLSWTTQSRKMIRARLSKTTMRSLVTRKAASLM